MMIRERGRKWVGLLTQLAFTVLLTVFIMRRLCCSIAWWDAALIALIAMAVGAVLTDSIAW